MLLGGYLQLALFALACYFGYQHEVFSRHLVSPLKIGLGLVAGHLIFGMSLIITQRSLRVAATHFVDFASLWRFAIESPTVLMQFISVAVGEELIYRVAAQPLLIQWCGHALWGILAVAVAFSCVHEHFFRNPAPQSAEFFGFALLLGTLYYWTGSLILVIVIHAVRNIEIAFLEHLMRVAEHGSEAQAARETEFLTGERLAVTLILPVGGFALVHFEYAGWLNQEARLAPVMPRAAEPCAGAPVEGS
jgi:membrane protease YdiL (CAAX protease family)